jgi:flagellar motor component MotA
VIGATSVPTAAWVLWQPYELVIIGGAALGAFLVGTPAKTVKQTLQAMVGVFKGPRYKQQDYIDVLSLLYELLNKARREGFMALEDHVERPAESALFGNYPKVQADHHLIDFITDCLRLMIGSNIEPHELEPLLELELEKHHAEAMAPSQVLTKVADGLPGFGIVAAVLGIVITMGSIGGDIVEVGGHVAGALVGTFPASCWATASSARWRRQWKPAPNRTAASTNRSRPPCWPACAATTRRSRWSLPARRCRRTCARPSPISSST